MRSIQIPGSIVPITQKQPPFTRQRIQVTVKLHYPVFMPPFLLPKPREPFPKAPACFSAGSAHEQHEQWSHGLGRRRMLQRELRTSLLTGIPRDTFTGSQNAWAPWLRLLTQSHYYKLRGGYDLAHSVFTSLQQRWCYKPSLCINAA